MHEIDHRRPMMQFPNTSLVLCFFYLLSLFHFTSSLAFF